MEEKERSHVISGLLNGCACVRDEVRKKQGVAGLLSTHTVQTFQVSFLTL
jgi:hypothetical protein